MALIICSPTTGSLNSANDAANCKRRVKQRPQQPFVSRVFREGTRGLSRRLSPEPFETDGLLDHCFTRRSRFAFSVAEFSEPVVGEQWPNGLPKRQAFPSGHYYIEKVHEHYNMAQGFPKPKPKHYPQEENLPSSPPSSRSLFTHFND